MNLEQFYKIVGSDYKEIIDRLGGNELLVIKFLNKFRLDNSFNELKNKLNENDTNEAFRMAHSLKGICANLGIQSLFVKASNVTELLRSGNINDAKKEFPDLEKEYNNVINLLIELN